MNVCACCEDNVISKFLVFQEMVLATCIILFYALILFLFYAYTSKFSCAPDFKENVTYPRGSKRNINDITRRPINTAKGIAVKSWKENKDISHYRWKITG